DVTVLPAGSSHRDGFKLTKFTQTLALSCSPRDGDTPKNNLPNSGPQRQTSMRGLPSPIPQAPLKAASSSIGFHHI
ncbi:hypothetical protein FQN60_001843, partial [Etheostoma spectabile]